jgi:tight adherence protein B
MALLIAIAVFILAFSLTYLAAGVIDTHDDREKRRLKQYGGYYGGKIPEADAPDVRGRSERSVKILLRKLGSIFESNFSEVISRELERADIPLKGSEFIVICIFIILVAGFIGYVISGGALFTTILLASAGATAPYLYLKAAQSRRLKRFNNQIGDALVHMSNSLKVGYGFMQAMEVVSKELPEPISIEFGRALKEMNLGASTETALANLVTRVGSSDLELVVTALLIQRQVGGNLSEILDNISFTIRERIRIKGEIKSLTAQGRISGVIISALPFCIGIFLYIINPDYIGILIKNHLGNIMLGISLAGMVIGIILVSKIVKIDI